MSEQSIQQPAVPQQPTWLSRLQRHLQNPVTLKELRSRMRGRRAFVVLTTYLATMSGIIFLVYLAFLTSSGVMSSDAQVAGQSLFATVVGIQAFLVLFVAPAFTANAISGEKERQTYDLLRTTLLSAPDFVRGKLFSALSYVILLILAAVPLQSFAFLLGGITFSQLFISQLLLIMMAITVAIFGLYCSSRMRTTLGASVITFAGVLLVTFGLPALVGLSIAITSPLFISSTTDALKIVLTYAGFIGAGLNLPATMILSNLMLIEEGSLFIIKNSSYGMTLYYLSPWITFLIFHALMAWGFYRGTVRNVRKVAVE